MVDVTDPSASVYVYNEEHRAVVVATTGVENERSGHFEAGEEVVFSFTFDNVLSPGRYSPVFQLAHRGSGLDVIDRFEGSFSFVVTGPGALGGLVDLPVHSASAASQPPTLERTQRMSVEAPPTEASASAQAPAIRVARPPDPRTARAHRRLAPLLAPHLQHRGDAVEAALLRLGAGLPVAAGQAPAAVPGAVRLLHQGRASRRRAKARAMTSTAPSCSPRSSCSRSSARRRSARCAAWSTTRPWFARSSSRAW